MKRLEAFYFTGTGNTRYVAQALGDRLAAAFEVRLHEITAREDFQTELKRADCVLLAFPIYGSSPPVPMRRFVHRHGDSFAAKEVIIVVTQFLFSGDGAASLGRTVESYGGRVRYAEHFRMPNNLADCKALKVRNGEELQTMLRRTDARIDRFARVILAGGSCRRGFSPVSHAVGYFCQRALWRKGEGEKTNALRIDGSRCIGCGACVRQCPVGNLRLEAGKARPLGQCALCYRCVNLCPKQAVTMMGKEPPAVQYKGPPKRRP